MSVPHHDTSPTPAANGAGGTAARRREPGIVLRCAAEPAARHVGIVFVHGIGSQAEGETLLDWGGAIIRVLFDTRVRNHLSADPVTDVELDPGPSQRRWIELQVPAANVDGHDVPEQHWVMTEAWWAQRVRPPSFGQMAEWLGPRGVIRRILTALLPRRGGAHDPRLRGWAESHALRRSDAGVVQEAVEPGPPDGMRQAPGAGPGRAVAGLGAGLFLQAVSALLLVLYGLLRSIEKLVPVGPLKDGALTRPLDRFVLEWFGDVYVLLSDTAQAASIRGQLVDAIEDLEAAGCDEIAIVAHSGGAIVSYMTLVDPSSAGLAVDRLITLGEGLNLAWRLTDSGGATPVDELDVPPERLYGSLLGTHPDLRWDDFWASQDPAPVGVLEVPAADDPIVDATLLARIRSHAIWNRLSFREDHGGYWDNDEEFLIPLLRLLAGGPDAATVFGDETADRGRSNRRRRRLSLLSYWRQLTAAGSLAAVAMSVALGTRTLSAAGDITSMVLGAVPGADLVTGPVGSIRAMDLAASPAGRLLAETGVWVIAAAVGLAAAYTLVTPPERAVPWARGRVGRWIGLALRLAPWVGGIPTLIAIIVAGIRFLIGSTPDARDAAGIIVVAGAVGLVLVLGARVVLGNEGADRTAMRDLAETLLMMLAMVVAAVLVVAPVFAILVFPEVGTAVVGTVAVVVAFQALGQVGTWRWSTWDARERALVRLGRDYVAFGRVVAQMTLLGIAFSALFIAAVFSVSAALIAALIAVVLLALVAVAVDVLDASHPRLPEVRPRQQADPPDPT